MGAAYRQLLVLLREAILAEIQDYFSLQNATTAYGCWLIRCHNHLATEALMDVLGAAVQSKEYSLTDVRLTEWFADGLVIEKNGDPFARFALTNNTRWGEVIVISIDLIRS